MIVRAVLAVILCFLLIVATTLRESCVEHIVVPTPMPSESVVPVLTPKPSLAAFAVPTAVSGAELSWPKLHLGVTGEVSHYGSVCPRCVALPFPWGPDWKVTISGPGGTWRGVSNDVGPVRSLHRIADLGLPIWEMVCGVPASMGICTATVTVTGKAR